MCDFVINRHITCNRKVFILCPRDRLKLAASYKHTISAREKWKKREHSDFSNFSAMAKNPNIYRTPFEWVTWAVTSIMESKFCRVRTEFKAFAQQNCQQFKLFPKILALWLQHWNRQTFLWNLFLLIVDSWNSNLPTCGLFSKSLFSTKSSRCFHSKITRQFKRLFALLKRNERSEYGACTLFRPLCDKYNDGIPWACVCAFGCDTEWRRQR